MKKFLHNVSLLCTLGSIFIPNAAHSDQKINTSRFGTVQVYSTSEADKKFTLFFTTLPLSPKDKSIIEILTKQGSSVAAIDTPTYLSQLQKDDGECYYLAGEIERLSQVIQSELSTGTIEKPYLLGIGEGAALTYVALSESSESFRGGISLNFCPTLSLSHPLCPDKAPKSSVILGDNKVTLEANPDLSLPWVIVQEQGDNCSYKQQRDFANRSGVGEWYLNSEENLEGIRQAVSRLYIKDTDNSDDEVEIDGVPVREYMPDAPSTKPFVIFLSGDGGWAAIDDGVSDRLSQLGMPVVGVNCLRYFWKKKSPEEAALELQEIYETYKKRLGREDVVFVGFSFGAEVIPAIVNRFDPKVREHVKGLVLLSAGLRTEFEIHLSDWLPMGPKEEGEEIFSEIKKLSRVICIAGEEDDESICPFLRNHNEWIVKTLPGAHHFDGDYDAVTKTIIESLELFMKRSSIN